MKRIVFILVIVFIFFIAFHYKENIINYYNKYFIKNDRVPTTLVKNGNYRDYNFNYVSNTTNFTPHNKQDILNIYYTVINSGMSNFTFYCDPDYETCLDDVKDIGNSQVTISNINNFVHPYNGFKDLETGFGKNGKITLKINRNYTDDMKLIIDYKVDDIIKKYISKDMTKREKIKTIHDYIINNTKYDQERSDKNIIKYKSDTAYGALIEGYALCGGYTDSMMLFLEKFGVKSYRISSDNHIWNYVYLDNTWYNLDLTWDDPITSDGKDILEDNFFLISDSKLLELDTKEHTFDKTVYSE